MMNEVLYMTGVVGVVFLVNYGLRVMPFLLFAGKDRPIPRWIEHMSLYLSPIIVIGLTFYAYSGLAWRTPWPYLAGVVTIAVQLWKRNPLASIAAGTVVYMCLLTTGCASRPPLVLDSEDPSVSVSTLGVKIGDNLVKPQEVVRALRDSDIPPTRVVHILLEPDVRDMKPVRQFMNYLRANGYTRAILVTKRHAESHAVEKPRKGFR